MKYGKIGFGMNKMKNFQAFMFHRNMNKKALEDSAPVWIVAILLIVAFLFAYLFGGSMVYADKRVGDERGVVINGASSLVVYEKFLGFLDSEIEGEKVIDLIKGSLDPYFELKDDNGERMVDRFGFRFMNASILGKGIWDKAENARVKFEYLRQNDSKYLTPKIIAKLDELCPIFGDDKYYLAIPQGVIDDEYFTRYESVDSQMFENNEQNLEFYTPSVSLKAVYRGHVFEIKFKIIKECLN